MEDFIAGRYETGDLSASKVVVQKGNNDISMPNWYEMYQKGKEMYEENPTVTSGLIWGCQWDQIMIWMKDVENPNVAGGYYIANAKGMGSLQTISGQAGQKIATGENENYKVKNIYDLLGNVYEFTMEAYSNNRRIIRRCLLQQKLC